MLLNWFPGLPGWDGIHPAMVHFPVALLLVAPLLVLVSLLVRPDWRPWAWSALAVMTLGALAAWLAVGSGHAAGQLVDKVRGLEEAISRHENLGMTTRNVFTALTVLYALLLLLPGWIKREPPVPVRLSVHAVFLVLYVGCLGTLAHTANAGGHLVHEMGVRAMVVPPASGSPVDVIPRAATPPPR